MEEDFDFFIKSEDYSDFDLLYKISRNNKIKYRYDRSYYIVDYFLNLFNEKYSKNDFEAFQNIYYNKYKEIQEQKIIKEPIKIYISDNYSLSDSSNYSVNEDSEIEENNDEYELTYEYKNKNKNKYIVYTSKNKIPTPPIFIKNKNFLISSNENSENEEYDTCNEVIYNESSEEEDIDIYE